MSRYISGRRVILSSLSVIGVLLALGWLSTPSAPAAPSPAAGCTACHAPGKAATLEASLKKIPNHPQLPSPAVAMCVACHKAQGKATPLGRVMHRRHLGVAAFAGTYKGTCTSCHAVDAKTGVVTVIGLPPR
jgi:cytochrome c553